MEGAHHWLISALLGGVTPPNLANLEKDFWQFLSAQNGQDVFISSEIFSQRIQSKNILETLNTIIHKAKKVGYTVLFVMFLRHHPEFINAIWAQTVKMFYMRGSAGQFVQSHIKIGLGDGLPRLLLNSKAETLILPFNRDVKTNGASETLLEGLGYGGITDLKPIERLKALHQVGFTIHHL